MLCLSTVTLYTGDRHIGGLSARQCSLPYRCTNDLQRRYHPWTTAAEAGPNRLGPLVTVQHYGLVDIDFAARTVTLALRDVNITACTST